jgi:hypothetical protein
MTGQLIARFFHDTRGRQYFLPAFSSAAKKKQTRFHRRKKTAAIPVLSGICQPFVSILCYH